MKKIISLVLIVVAMLIFTIPAFAANENAVIEVKSDAGEYVSPSMEVTEWRFRVYNGRLEMRLWSVTFGRWLTEWMPV